MSVGDGIAIAGIALGFGWVVSSGHGLGVLCVAGLVFWLLQM